jgi:hypothetical protein
MCVALGVRMTKLPLLLAVPVVVFAQGAAAAPTDLARTLELEVVEVTKTSTETVRLALVLDGRGTSQLSLPIGGLFYTYRARIEGAQSGKVPATISLRRSDPKSNGGANIDVDAGATLASGVRTIVANVARPDGSRIELALTLK